MIQPLLLTLGFVLALAILAVDLFVTLCAVVAVVAGLERKHIGQTLGSAVVVCVTAVLLVKGAGGLVQAMLAGRDREIANAILTIDKVGGSTIAVVVLGFITWIWLETRHL